MTGTALLSLAPAVMAELEWEIAAERGQED
jgi:hypothetical protein